MRADDSEFSEISRAERVSELLTAAIHAIRSRGKHATVGEVETLMAERLNLARSSIQSFRYHRRLPSPEYMAELAALIAEESALGRAWIEEFLRAGGHPEWERIARQLFPDTEASAPLATSAPPTVVAPTRPPVSDVPPLRRAPVVAALLTLLLLATLLTGAILYGRRPPPPDEGSFLRDGSFEGGALSLWRNVGGCKLEVAEGDARAGERFATVEALEPCVSISQDAAVTPVLDRRYTFSAWVRAPEGDYPELELVIFEGKALSDGFNDLAQRTERVTVRGSDWQCVQTTLPVSNPDSTLLRAELYFKSPDARYQLDELRFVEGDEGVCPPPPLTLHNPSFEEGADIAPPWEYDSSCFVALQKDGSAPEGNQFLAVAPLSAACLSVRQVVPYEPAPDEPIRFHIWAKSSDGSPRELALTLWGRGSGEIKGGHTFTVEGSDWKCLEATLVSGEVAVEELIAEVYLWKRDGTPYLLDGAGLSSGAGGCPLPPLHMTAIDRAVEQREYAAGTGIPISTTLVNEGDAPSEPGTITFWLSERLDSDPVEGATIVPDSVPPIPPGSSLALPEDFIAITVAQAPGEYYLVGEVQGTGQRLSLPEPITVVACQKSDTFYCDVSADHWAYREIQRWADLNVTNGCRSGTDPFNNRPYCPNQAVTRWALTVFLVRHLETPETKPAQPYEGLFADIAEGYNFAPYIEYVALRGIDMGVERCAPTETRPNFCPDDVVRRGEFAEILAQALNWDLSDVDPDAAPYTDLDGMSDRARRAVAHMWAEGIISPHVPDCPPTERGPRFCPDQPLRRANAARLFTHAFGLVDRSP